MAKKRNTFRTRLRAYLKNQENDWPKHRTAAQRREDLYAGIAELIYRMNVSTPKFDLRDPDKGPEDIPP